MEMGISVSLEGLDDLKAALEKLKLSDEEKTQIELTGAEVIADLARDYVPVDKGDLLDSIEVIEEGGEVFVQAGTDHAAPVEFGTYKMQAQPYLRPAISVGKDDAVREMSKALMEKLDELSTGT